MSANDSKDVGCDDLSQEVFAEAEAEIAFWLTSHWTEIRDGATPGLRDLVHQLQLILCKPYSQQDRSENV